LKKVFTRWPVASGFALVLLLFSVLIVFAVWYTSIRTPVTLGTAEVVLEYSVNGVDGWTAEMPVLFNNPEFSEDGLVSRSFWLRSSGSSPAEHNLCILAEGETIQGNSPQGSVIGADIRKYFSVESYQKDGVPLKTTIVDQDLDGERTLFDLAEQSIEAPASCVAFGSFEPHQIELGLQFYQSAKLVDDLHGDSWVGNLVFVLR